MTLDAQAKAFLDQATASGAPPLYEMSVPDARAALKTLTKAVEMPGPEVGKTEERLLPGAGGGIPVRIYRPPSSREGAGTLPVVLLIHGGGFALGDLDTHDVVARHYCAAAGVLVVSIDYRLAPEHKFPSAVEDCYSVLCWVHDRAEVLGADPERIAVTGDSAGGNLSAVICQLAKQRQGPAVACQVLLYPVLSLALQAAYPSRSAMGTGEYFLGLKDMEWFNGMYLRTPADEKDPRASPILTEDLSGLPPALILTAGYDPLRDEGAEYATRLGKAGVPVAHRCFEGAIHGFASFSGAMDAGREALDQVAEYLRRVLR